MTSLTRVSAALVYWIGTMIGSKTRTVDSKLQDLVSVLDYGAVGDGVTDDTAAINAAIASFGTTGGTLLVPKITKNILTQYLTYNLVNPYGVKFIGDGDIISPNALGNYNKLNLYGNDCRVANGREYLHRIYDRMQKGQIADIHLFGDSTVEGLTGESPPYNTGAIVFDMLQAKGLNIRVTNHGIGGTSWYQMDAVSKLTTSTDLFIIKYNINDGGTPGSSDRLGNWTAALRSKLAEIRANPLGTKNNLSIIIMGASSTNDTQHNRDARWYEKQRDVLIKAARDFQCAYYDTYGDMPDVDNSANYSMDDPFGTGQSVHPRDTMQCWIWGGMLDYYFSFSQVEKMSSTKHVNVPSAAGTPPVGTSLINYNMGISCYRALPTSGYDWPINGMVITYRSPENVGYQLAVTFDQSNSYTIKRTWNTNTGTWNRWVGLPTQVDPLNGWQSTSKPTVTPCDSGIINVSGFISGGNTADGTQVLRLPDWAYPVTEKRFAVANNDGTLTVVGVNSAGWVFLVGGATKATGVHINFNFLRHT